MRFSDTEIQRYARQMVMPEIGGTGQDRLRAAHVRASGEVEALYLAAAGVGVLFVPTEAIAEAARALNPHVDVQVIAGQPQSDDVESQSMRALSTLKEILGL
jgi:adenylyltransferase/sulfurtransferase